MSRHIGCVGDILMHVVMCVSEDWVKAQSSVDLLCHHPWLGVILRENSAIPVCCDSMYSLLI